MVLEEETFTTMTLPKKIVPTVAQYRGIPVRLVAGCSAWLFCSAEKKSSYEA